MSNHPMNLKNRIDAFIKLGEKLQNLSPAAFRHLAQEANHKNPWFVPKNVHMAFQGIIKFLEKKTLKQWTASYSLDPDSPKTIGVVMAGNIPLVGFHDFLSVLIAGHILQTKLSSQDTVLLSYIAGELTAIEPKFSDRIFFQPRLSKYDAIIATGSNNTSRYFKYYFKHVPHIIRANRSSCALLSGQETGDELKRLGNDIFSYFGLGCRNVSKIYVPKEYDFTLLMKAWEKHTDIALHHKYANNYNYQKSILLINQQHFFDNGVVILVESEALVSPISVIYYEQYHDSSDLKDKINQHKDRLQCIVANSEWNGQSVDFGETQFPKVWDYADNVDTLKFITAIK